MLPASHHGRIHQSYHCIRGHRIHIDYAGPLEGKMFLLIVDAHSRWLEIHSTNLSMSTATIELMRKTFAGLGLPEVMVSDNATAFTSAEFSEFLRNNGFVTSEHHRTTQYQMVSSNALVRLSKKNSNVSPQDH